MILVYRCPKCYSDITEKSNFCEACGCNLQEIFNEEAEIIKNPICPTCNKTYPTGIKFCSEDGSKLVPSEKLMIRCIKCGKSFPTDTKFCDIDGTNLQDNYLCRNENFREPMPETYQVLSIVVFILCIVPLGLILTLPEIFNASKVKRLYESGEIESAKKLSRRIKNGLVWSVACTVVFWIVVIIGFIN